MPDAAPQPSSAQELYFLYELAKSFSSSLELDEVAETVLDGACALIGTEQGFLCALAFPGSDAAVQPLLQPLMLRGIAAADLQALLPRLAPVWEQRQVVKLEGTGSGPAAWRDLIAGPLVVRDQVHGLLGVMTATARPFTPREEERLNAAANLGALALENARLHDRIQREVKVLRALIQAAQQMGAGQLTPAQIAELEHSAGWGEISLLSQAFALMARQVIDREAALHQKVRELEIVIDEARRDRQIAEITETEYFQRIQQKVAELRAKRGR